MKNFRFSLLAFAVIALLATGVGTALAGAHATTTGAKVSLARTGLGPVLVDGRGHTLYLFEKDTKGKSTCSGGCASFWPPLITGSKPLAFAGAKASLLGTTRRADGRLQVTYNHHPLYTFAEDVKKGQAKGEGLNIYGAEWYAVSQSGNTVEKATAPSGSGGGSSTPTPGGYGY